ncbi:MAG: glycosyltransferase family 39 protein [Gemmatimonadota bacterium]|jgi:hypothetical protein
MIDVPDRTKRTPLLVAAALVLGAVLRIVQWSAGTSMWLDELQIARNVRDRALPALLFEPLDYRQMAPPGFLASVKAAVATFGLDERALRLVPLLMGILALLLLWRVAHRFVTGLPLAGVLLVSAASPALVWYSGNVKQYSGDVALSLLLVLLALRHVEQPMDTRRAGWAAALGALAMISSYAAVLTGAVLGLVLLGHWLGRRRTGTFRPLGILGGGWLLGAVAAAWASLRLTDPAVREFMRDFHAAGFAPWKDGIVAVLLWIPGRVFNALAHYMVFLEAEAGGLAIPVAILALAGVAVVASEERLKGMLLAAPLLAALLGGLTQTLPMRHRLAVYAGAPVLVFGMIGLQALLARRSRWVQGAGALLALLAIAPLPLVVLAMNRPPYRSQETRPVLAALAERMRADDAVYIYCPAVAAADFYGPTAGVTDYIAGGCHATEGELIDELRALPEGRVWFFFTQWTPGLPWPDTAQAFLANVGREAERIDDPYGLTGQSDAAAILYELPAADAPDRMARAP